MLVSTQMLANGLPSNSAGVPGVYISAISGEALATHPMGGLKKCFGHPWLPKLVAVSAGTAVHADAMENPTAEHGYVGPLTSYKLLYKSLG